MELFHIHPPDIRPASDKDIDILVTHHRKMFEEIWEKKGTPLDPDLGESLATEYVRKLRSELQTGACVAWVITRDGSIVSSGAISIMSYVPNPFDISCTIAFLHSVYTDKEYRGLRNASHITHEALKYCREKGIKRLYLFASDEGRPIYENQGFIPVDNMMISGNFFSGAPDTSGTH